MASPDTFRILHGDLSRIVISWTLAIVSEGYTRAQLDKGDFDRDAKLVVDELLATAPFDDPGLNRLFVIAAVRVEYERPGSEITLHYDPLLAKLIVWAPDRAQAVSRMHRALLELTIEGVDTSRDFHLRVMEDAEFRAGAIEIQWLERRLAELTAAAPPRDSVVRAAVAAVLLAERDRNLRRLTPKGSTQAIVASESPTAWLEVARREGLR